jgi:hypothetical protein
VERITADFWNIPQRLPRLKPNQGELLQQQYEEEQQYSSSYEEAAAREQQQEQPGKGKGILARMRSGKKKPGGGGSGGKGGKGKQGRSG